MSQSLPAPERRPAPAKDGYKTLSATRTAVHSAAAGAAATPAQKAKAWVENAGLNAFSVGKELVEDFRRQDRYFKYKASILGSWLLLTLLTFAVAWPSRVGDGNSLRAQLVTTQVGNDQVYSLQNHSKDPWLDVRVVVNGVWQLASPRVEPGESLTFETRRLTGLNGDPAPKDLLISDLLLKTEDGSARLISNGAVVP